MSWDIIVQDLPRDAKTVADIPEDFEPQPLMPRHELIARILDVVPGADFSDPTWGLVEGTDYSIEVSIGDEDPVISFAFHVRGGDMVVGVVAAILDHLGLRAIDPGQGEDGTGFFDPSLATESLQQWRAFRDRAVASVDPAGVVPEPAPERGLAG